MLYTKGNDIPIFNKRIVVLELLIAVLMKTLIVTRSAEWRIFT
jgi:hypothetical protein